MNSTNSITPPNSNLQDNPGFLAALIGDGRPLLLFTGLSLVLAGVFALFLSVTGHFLPHDIAYLGQDAASLCHFYDCRIVDFMFHDRVAFGGTLIAIGVLYLWLVMFPLRVGEPWAWWTFLLSGLVGFASFLTYLGYGYLDTWHGAATLLLLPCFIVGLIKSYSTLMVPKSIACLRQPATAVPWLSEAGLGRLALLGTAFGLISAGLTIMIVGMSIVFVPQDLVYMGTTPANLAAISPRLIPLIAHDRAGFGGGLCSAGVAMFFCLWCSRPCKSLWQALALAGLAGFSCALGVHFAVGYVDFVHLLPAYLGALIYGTGLALSYPSMVLGLKVYSERGVQ
jgi:hypothetical protein